ncbi:MAG: DUF1801 domain-containing protein [Steroidobacteraceae bacterium]
MNTKKNKAASARPAVRKAPAARPRQIRRWNSTARRDDKFDGDVRVQAYIAAMPEWMRGFGERLDAMVTRHAPHAQRAVKWNSPVYGIEGQGWFMAMHVFRIHVKVSFFAGTSLKPVPPGGTGNSARWIDVYEDDLHETMIDEWIRQAIARPGT